MAKICEHCGAGVYGDVCEYCDMPVNNRTAPPKIIYKSEQSESTVSISPKTHRRFKLFILILIAVIILFKIIHTVAEYNRINRHSAHNVTINYAHQPETEYSYNHEKVDKTEKNTQDKPVYSAMETFQKDGAFPSGTYQIGVDMPEGIYIFIPELSNAHGVQGVYSDPECNNQISSAYVHFDGTRIAEISGNGYVHFSWATAYNLDMHPEIVNDPHETDGMFIVGRDIEAGTYHLESPSEIFGDMSDNAEWYIYSNINAVGAVMKESGQLETYGGYMENITDEITLSDGEYLELRHCIVK